jgi:predicted flap endonuclease-1-like 5' DNA nuclease
MLDILNPCNDPNAWWQQLLMLGIPFLLGLLWPKNKVEIADDGLSAKLASLDADLAACRNNTKNAEESLNSFNNLDNGNTTSNSLTATNYTSKSKKDDLKVVEGIGPKIEGIFNDAGILTFEQLANTTATRLKEILDGAGSRYQMHDPTTWPAQSKLANDGKWEELKKWQDELNKGTA